MKKIFFYSNHREYDGALGITHKVHGEINALRELGYEVVYSAYTKDGVAVFDNSGNVLYECKHTLKLNALNRITRRGLLLKCCNRYLKSDKTKYDIGYLRFHFFDAKYYSLIKMLKKHESKIVVEAHAFPYKAWKNPELWVTYVLDSIYTPIIKKKIDLVAIMSLVKDPWGIRSVQIDNGVDLKDYRLKKQTKDNYINLISVTNERKFHAYDKVVKGLKQYYENGGEEKIIIRFVGEYMRSTKKLVIDLGLQNNCVFLGKMSGIDLDNVFDESDIGLGAFSHRSDDSGSCIKTKEYFARGIPFVNGWKEPAFDDSYPYVLRFDTKSEIIDFHRIEEFSKKIKGDKKVATEMRKFAEENYTWEKQMRTVIEIIETMN